MTYKGYKKHDEYIIYFHTCIKILLIFRYVLNDYNLEVHLYLYYVDLDPCCRSQNRAGVQASRSFFLFFFFSLCL